GIQAPGHARWPVVHAEHHIRLRIEEARGIPRVIVDELRAPGHVTLDGADVRELVAHETPYANLARSSRVVRPESGSDHDHYSSQTDGMLRSTSISPKRLAFRAPTVRAQAAIRPIPSSSDVLGRAPRIRLAFSWLA